MDFGPPLTYTSPRKTAHMANTDQINIIGRLTADPVLRFTTQGTAVANFRLARNERHGEKDGDIEPADGDDVHRVIMHANALTAFRRVWRIRELNPPLIFRNETGHGAAGIR